MYRGHPSESKMDLNLISELATSVIDWPTVAQTVSPHQQFFQVQLDEAANKMISNTTKPDFVPHSSDSFPIQTSMNVLYSQNTAMLPNAEQVPMDDYDPLETFTFWDGETFYCSHDSDPICAVSPDLPPENDMMDLPEYVVPIGDEHIAKDNLFLMKESDLLNSPVKESDYLNSPIKGPDLLNNPTLAELNSGDESFFDYAADSFLCDEANYLLNADLLSKSLPAHENNFVNFMSNNSAFSSNGNIFHETFAGSKNSQTVLSSSCPVPTRVVPCSQFVSACNDKVLVCPQNSPASDFYSQRPEQFSPSNNKLSLNMPLKIESACTSIESAFSPNSMSTSSLLSTSAPPTVTMSSTFCLKKEEKVVRPTRCKSAEKSLSGFSALSLSNDDESGSYFDDSDHDDDFSSDDDFGQYDGDDLFSSNWPSGKDPKGQQRKHRYFWQYNLQSRGIKTQNLLPHFQVRDPHILHDALDPVFAEDCTLPVKHSGKARRGDGNDLTPNPRKLYSIGIELKKLNRLIYNMNPVHEFGSQTKPLSRKEKNKLASRVCRLKKKAQHEANKIKLYGLQQEHKRLLTILMDMKRLIKCKVQHLQENKKFSNFVKLENYLMTHEPYKVAENTTEFVNEVLEKIAKGEHDGGLGKL